MFLFLRNSTKNTTQLGIVSSDVISGPMSLMKPGTLFTSIWAKWPSFYSRAARDKKIKTTVWSLKKRSLHHHLSHKAFPKNKASKKKKFYFVAEKTTNYYYFAIYQLKKQHKTKYFRLRKKQNYKTKPTTTTYKKLNEWWLTSIWSAVVLFLLMCIWFGLFCGNIKPKNHNKKRPNIIKKILYQALPHSFYFAVLICILRLHTLAASLKTASPFYFSLVYW